MRKTGIVYFDDAVKTEVLGPISGIMSGKPSASTVANSIQATAKRAAKNMAEDTQWIYRSGSSAKVLNGKAGRWLGQFGTWPSNYLQFLKRGVSSGDPIATRQFIARWAAVQGAFQGLGELLGIEMGPWIWFGPITYSGGPATEALIGAHEILQPYPWRRRMGWNRLERVGMTTVPYYLALRDYLLDPLQESETGDVIKQILGQRPKEDNFE